MERSQPDYKLNRSRMARPLWFLTAIILPAAGACAAHVTVNRQAMIFKEFSDRVQHYVELHKRAEAGLPPLKKNSSATEIHNHEAALAGAIRSARPNARHEDIFFDGVAAAIRTILRTELNGPQGEQLKSAIRDSNPDSSGMPGRVRLAVNASYPVGVPLSTVPPSLLLNLPKLPQEVEYRFVGRHLILRDVTANLIVDYIWEAAPHL